MSELKKILEELPTQSKSPCKDCGSRDWTSCNEHPDGGFYECNQCTVWNEKEQKLERKNLQ